jgi:hypothetical protein
MAYKEDFFYQGNYFSVTVDAQVKTTTLGNSVYFLFYDKVIPAGYTEFIYLNAENNGNWYKKDFGNWTSSAPVGNTTTLTYTPTSNSFSRDNPDYCKFLYHTQSGGIDYQQMIVYARILSPEIPMYSRMSALNNRSMFTLNVKDKGGSDDMSIVQLYTSVDGKIHEDFSGNLIQDARFSQQYLFGPYTSQPCMITITNQTYDKTSIYKGTSSSLIQANGFSTYSDYRIKSNIESLNNTHTVDNIRAVKYTTSDNSTHFGVIAHELAEVYPQLVMGKKDDEKYQSVAYTELTPILINEIQIIKKELLYLQKEIETLKNIIET